MDEEDLENEILKYTDISGDGKLITYNTTGNPFITSSQQFSGESRQDFNNRITREIQERNHQTLIQKTEQLKSHIPSVTTGATSQVHSRLQTRSASMHSQPLSTKKQPRERTKTMPECMLQKRQIYLTQLLIDKKRAEMRKIARNQVLTQDKMDKDEKDVNNEIDEYKQSMNALQAALSRSRKKAAENSQQYSSLVKTFSQLQSSVNAKSAIISKNEEILEQYEEYAEFLKIFLPREYEKRMFDYFNNPLVLIKELDELQTETLNLVNCYQHFVDVEGVLNEKTEAMMKEQDDEDNKINKIIEKTELPKIETFQSKKVETDKDILTAKIDNIKNTISETYMICFGHKADISPMNMLEKIEQSLEQMLKIEQTVDPDVLEKIKAQKEEERREKERQEGHERRRLEQLQKYQKALERANKEIPRHDKRRPIERMIPVKKHHTTDHELDKARLALEMENRMLFSNDE